MPSKKKKYNARFPAGRIKKIMQTDEEVGKVAQAVPVIISRTLELFVESLLTKAMEITSAKNAKTLSPSHMKQCILSESRFDFLKDLVKTLPDSTACDSEDGSGQTNIQQSNNLGKPDTLSSGIWRQREGVGTLSIREDQEHMPVSSPTVVSNRINPNFYKESEEVNIGSESFGQQDPTTIPQGSFMYPSVSETHEIDDSGGENEYQVPVVVPQYIQPQGSAMLDEDYDT